MSYSTRIHTKLRQIRSQLAKAESIAQVIELKSENKSGDCLREKDELTRRLSRLRVMLQEIGRMRSTIEDPETMDTIRFLIARYDNCVKTVELSMIHTAVRKDRQSGAAVSPAYSDGEGDPMESLLDKKTTVKIDGQEITVSNTEEMQDTIKRSRKLESLRRDVAEVLEVFQDVKELVQENQEPIDRLHEHVSEAKENAIQSERQLARSVRFSQSALGWGLAGAAVGGIIGGPIGVALGSKVATVAMCLGVGSTTGTIGALGLRSEIKKAHEKVAEAGEAEAEMSKRK
uniref:t-SNARE coiled-coil homology domain-containing protein n=1 Tax=Lotharella globosa TaxID=91324 RepID=A0A6V3J3C1_9EUKA|mmetsp:Transcript_21450/g.43029  ORF Transcript_21450/g.43029 Transcript_21450/m.43029 type:complete len:288 (+) Transcript_21450:57-920(+)|eukprot:CAMPEP_0167816982 /NCGR_PEP_ID=MMETSP0112_2-20121227/3926_1 /TAXON_ID=91324 /ORGANISM="Lotharella globosa, Strain CCCM811" /LENGTH=287 /DNA_ID=CAMNT_0007716665 /DNA_START=34 /DNA_END=897 /DNA_ORIENTATION=+